VAIATHHGYRHTLDQQLGRENLFWSLRQGVGQQRGCTAFFVFRHRLAGGKFFCAVRITSVMG
jgi:hypothetical protein